MAGLTLKQNYNTYEEENLGFAAVTATGSPGGQLTKKWNTVAGTSGGSLLQLPKANIGQQVSVFNGSGVNIFVNVKSGSGDLINGGSSVVLVNVNATVLFFVSGTGNWTYK